MNLAKVDFLFQHTCSHILDPHMSFVKGSVRRMWRTSVTARGMKPPHATIMSAPCACSSAFVADSPLEEELDTAPIVNCVSDAQRELP